MQEIPHMTLVQYLIGKLGYNYIIGDSKRLATIIIFYNSHGTSQQILIVPYLQYNTITQTVDSKRAYLGEFSSLVAVPFSPINSTLLVAEHPPPTCSAVIFMSVTVEKSCQ